MLKHAVFHTPKDAESLFYSLAEDLQRLGYTQRTTHEIKLACHEALANAWSHGNGSDPRKRMDVRYRCSAEGFFIRIEDEGAGFDPESVPDPTLPENLGVPRGRGLLLMRSFMEEVRFEKEGRAVVMSRSRAWTRDAS